MKSIKLKEWAMLFTSLILAVVFGLSVNLLLDALINDTLINNTPLILMSCSMIILSYLIGSEMFSYALHTIRSRKIQTELDMERAFRKMGDN